MLFRIAVFGREVCLQIMSAPGFSTYGARTIEITWPVGRMAGQTDGSASPAYGSGGHVARFGALHGNLTCTQVHVWIRFEYTRQTSLKLPCGTNLQQRRSSRTSQYVEINLASHERKRATLCGKTRASKATGHDLNKKTLRPYKDARWKL